MSFKNLVTISLGKYGTFQSNLAVGRPYNVTYELVGKQEGDSSPGLRIVPASELHADVLAEENAAANPDPGESDVIGGDGVDFTLVGENGEVLMRSNRETIDDSARQTLTMQEIEALKRDVANAGQDIIARLMSSHTAIDEKTKFSLAKYKLTKTKKFLKRFTILPLDVPMLAHYLTEEKDNTKIMELSQEMIGLAGCWANIHYAGSPDGLAGTDELSQVSGGRWLVIDESGGLLVAAMAERMGILYPEDEDEDEEGEQAQDENEELPEPEDNMAPAEPAPAEPLSHASSESATQTTRKQHHRPRDAPFVTSNTLTLIHNNSQPNLFLLKYFNHDPNTPHRSHPLTHHLRTISWLQLLSPEFDPAYTQPPPTIAPAELLTMKSGKRGNYYRKLRRHLSTKAVVDSTRAGGFDGLIVTSNMSPVSILHHLVPLLKGGAPLVIYSPVIEPLVELADLYSTSRKTAFITSPPLDTEISPIAHDACITSTSKIKTETPDFPLNPTLLLSVSIQASKVRRWQVLPGRTHPLMTGRGGGDGYLFTGIRVVPAEGKVEARGKFGRRKIAAIDVPAPELESGSGSGDVDMDVEESKKRKRD